MRFCMAAWVGQHGASARRDRRGCGAPRRRGAARVWVCVAMWAASSATVGSCGRRPPAPGEAIQVQTKFGEVGTSPGQFSFPRAMDASMDADGGASLWIVDKLGRVQKVDVQTGRCEAWWRMPVIVLGKPTGITIGPRPGGEAGTGVWLADTHYHQILVYDADDATLPAPGREPREPRLVAKFGSYGEEPGQFVYVTDVALKLDESGGIERVYVSEYGGNDRITCLDGEFNVLFTIGEFGDSASAERVEFNRPQAIGIDTARDELIVVDSCNHRIGRFTLDGALVGWIGSPESAGEALGSFRYPWGLYLPGDGTALVVEQQGARVQQIDLGTGECLGSWGRAGVGEGELATPWAVTMIGRRAYVLDTGNNRVIGFDGPRAGRAPRVASTAGLDPAASGRGR